MAINLTKAAFVYLKQDGKILMEQEGGRLAIGLWSLPGGHVEEEESLVAAAIREVKEECGYKVSLGEIIYQSLIPNAEYKGTIGDTDQVKITIFRGTIVGGALTKDDQALDLKWLTKEEILQLPLRWDFLRGLIIE
jgi:ADP-ribose pyrophosphatase YjhB (NUDIX family)